MRSIALSSSAKPLPSAFPRAVTAPEPLGENHGHYCDIGTGVCRWKDGSDLKYPPWGWGGSNEEKVAEQCNKQKSCLGFARHNNGRYQIFCSEKSGACHHKGQGVLDINAADEKYQGPCFKKANLIPFAERCCHGCRKSNMYARESSSEEEVKQGLQNATKHVKDQNATEQNVTDVLIARETEPAAKAQNSSEVPGDEATSEESGALLPRRV